MAATSSRAPPAAIVQPLQLFLAPRPSPALSPPRTSHWLAPVLPPLLGSAIRSPAVGGACGQGWSERPDWLRGKRRRGGGGRFGPKLKRCRPGAGLAVGGACWLVGRKLKWRKDAGGGTGAEKTGGFSRDPWVRFRPSVPNPLPRPPSRAGGRSPPRPLVLAPRVPVK